MRSIFFAFIFFITSTVRAAEATPGYASTESFDSYNCSLAASAIESCKSSPKEKFVFQLPGKDITVDCEFLKKHNASCKAKNKGQCSSEKESMTKVASERMQSCKKVGGCDGGRFVTCESYLEEQELESLEEDSKTPINKAELVRSCPFFAKGAKEEKAAQIEDAADELVKTEKKLEEHTKKMKEDQEKATKDQAQMTEDASDLEAQAQKAMGELQIQLGDITNASTETVNKIRNAITSLYNNLQQGKITDTGKTDIDYQKVLDAVQQQCYKVGLAAAAAESARLKAGVSNSDSASVASKGTIQHLRGKANSAYADCQKSRMYSGALDTAFRLKTDSQKLMQIKIDTTNNQIAELKKEFASLPQKAEGEKKSLQQQKFQEIQSLMSQAQQKRQLLAQLAQANQVTQGQMLQELFNLQRTQYEQQKFARALKLTLNEISASDSSAATAEMFYDAQGANESWWEAKLSMHHACCPDGKVIEGETGKNVCLSNSDLRTLRDRGSDTDSSSSGLGE